MTLAVELKPSAYLSRDMDLLRANGDPAHCHWTSTKARSSTIDPTILLAILFARARRWHNSRFGHRCTSLLIQPAVRCGWPVLELPAAILRPVLIGRAAGREREC